MQFRTLKKNTGVLYIAENFVYKRHSSKKGVKYLKCYEPFCNATAKIVNGSLVRTSHSHCHSDSRQLIQELELIESCRNVAESERGSLRRIFDDQCDRFPDASTSTSFVNLESSMYKRRKKTQVPLPRNLSEAG